MILVVGAAHLDIVGEYNSIAANVIDKPGRIFYSVGGSAYNIAANLAQNGRKVRFVSILKSDSLVTPIILSRLESYNIATDLVQVRDDVVESGFIAQRQEGVLVSAVASSAADKLVYPPGQFDESVRDSTHVIACANCSSAFLDRLSSACRKYGKKLFVSGVSETKVKKLLSINRSMGAAYPVYCASMNRFEATSIGFDLNAVSNEYVRDFAGKIGCEVFIVTDESRGYHIFFSTGEYFAVSAPDVAHVASPTGAGDALFAAFIDHVIERNSVDVEECHRYVCRYVSEILAREGATVGARTAPGELQVVPKTELDMLRKRHIETFGSLVSSPISFLGLKISFGNLLALIGILIASASFVFGHVVDLDSFLSWVGLK